MITVPKMAAGLRKPAAPGAPAARRLRTVGRPLVSRRGEEDNRTEGCVGSHLSAHPSPQRESSVRFPVTRRAHDTRRRAAPPSTLVAATATLCHAPPQTGLKDVYQRRVALPGLDLTVIELPNKGFFTLVWQVRTGPKPQITSQEAQVPALHWYVICAPAW